MNTKTFQIMMLMCITFGLLLIAIGAVLPILQHSVASDTFKYIYATGAGLHLLGRLFSPYRGDDFTLKRLHRIESWSGVVFAAAAFLMFYLPGQSTDWVAFTLAGAAILIYTSIRIPMATRSYEKRRAQARTNDKGRK